MLSLKICVGLEILGGDMWVMTQKRITLWKFDRCLIYSIHSLANSPVGYFLEVFVLVVLECAEL